MPCSARSVVPPARMDWLAMFLLGKICHSLFMNHVRVGTEPVEVTHNTGCTRCRVSRCVRYCQKMGRGLKEEPSSVGMMTLLPSKAVSALCAGKKKVYPSGIHSTVVLCVIFRQLRAFLASGMLSSARRRRPLNPVMSSARKRQSS